MNFSNYQIEFKKLLNRDYFSADIHPLRKDAFSKLMTVGFPTQKWEEWRFTNISDIINNNYSISDANDSPDFDIDFSHYNLEGVDTIIIYNGHFQAEHSSIPKGVEVHSLSDFYKNDNHQKLCLDNSPFDLLNTAFMDSGLCLIIPEKKCITRPIKILFISNGTRSIMINPRIHIEVQKEANVSIIEEYIGNSTSFFQNETIFIDLKENANCEHIRIQSNSNESNNIFNIHSKLDKDSSYNFFQYTDGGKLSRSSIYVDLNNQNAECNINCLSLSKSNQHLDNSIIINHNSPNTYSKQFVKSILFDKSTGVFNGRTVVKKDAQKIEAHQTNNNLLLSKLAKMNSIPQLEIYADDVKCTHGSTSGQLDEDALFYFQSRGIPKKQAFMLLITGFISEVMENIKFNPVKNYLNQKIDMWISK